MVNAHPPGKEERFSNTSVIVQAMKQSGLDENEMDEVIKHVIKSDQSGAKTLMSHQYFTLVTNVLYCAQLYSLIKIVHVVYTIARSPYD
jgi:hypothetical protein